MSEGASLLVIPMEVTHYIGTVAINSSLPVEVEVLVTLHFE
jgi:hypothetical protein